MKKMRERKVKEVEIMEQVVRRMSKDEVWKALKSMKNGKAGGSDETTVEYLTNQFKMILDTENLPEE